MITISPKRFLKEKFNLLFVFSLGFFVGGTINFISNIFYPDNLLVNETYNYVNFIFDSGILFLIILITVIFSFVNNYFKTKKLHLKHSYNSTMFLTGVETSVMLFGTLTSLVFFLYMSFSNDPFLQLLTVIAAVMMMYANHKRPELIEKIANRLKTK